MCWSGLMNIKHLCPPLLSPPQGSSLSAGGPQGLLERHCRRVDRALLNRFQHTLTVPQTRPILQPETLPSAKKSLRERLNYVNSPPVYCVYGKLSAKEELLRKDSGYKNILMKQGVVNNTYSRLKHWHAKARLEFTKNWEVFERNNDLLMVFLIQTFPQVHSWSENKLQSLAKVVVFSLAFNEQEAFKVEQPLHHRH